MTQQQKDNWAERIESLDGPPVDEIRERAIQEYGNDPHSFGGQRDGFVKGFLAAKDKIAAQFFETISNQEMNLAHISDENKRLKEGIANALHQIHEGRTGNAIQILNHLYESHLH